MKTSTMVVLACLIGFESKLFGATPIESGVLALIGVLIVEIIVKKAKKAC